MKKLFVVLVMLVAMNASGQWEHLNFVNGGNSEVITRDSSGYLFIAANSGQIYRSSDNGNSWQLFTNDFPNTGINCFISTMNGTYAGTYPGIYKTTNHGINWLACNNGLPNNPDIQCFALKDNFIFAGALGGTYIFRSSNNGSSWDTLRFNGSTKTIVASGSVLYAEATAGSQGTMYKSTNNGANWISINNGLPGFSMDNLDKCGNKVYASSWGDGLFVTTNEGDNWTQLTGVNEGIRTMVSKGDTLVACYYFPDKTFYVTTNGGATWQTKLSDLPESLLQSILWTPSGLIGTSYLGIYKSSNLGLNWINISNGYTDVEIKYMTARSNIVIAKSLSQGTYRSTDYGLNWNKVNYYLNTFNWQNNILYSFSGSYIMRSSDLGSTFSQYGSPIPMGLSISSLVMWSSTMVSNINYLVYSNPISYIYRSTNSGLNWVQSNNGLPSGTPGNTGFFNRDSICFIGLERPSTISWVLFRSTNFGLSWDSIPNTSSIAQANMITYNTNDNKFYLCRNNGVYVSSNLGNNWLPINNGLPASKNATSLFFNGDTIYASLKPGGIYRSTVQNQTWVQYNDGLTNLNVNSVNGSNNYLYAGVTYGGFFRRQANIFNSVENNSEVIKDYMLYQNYPNPFNPMTNVKFSIVKAGDVKIVVYDVQGREVQTLANERLNAGTYEVKFDGSGLTSGVYFYRMVSDGYSETKKMLLVK
jgi:photosystem II stability/assembly factor-like uncharacterized protein